MSSTVTVSKAFRGQLQNLMATLRATEPHYIKCIKPNNVKAPGGFRYCPLLVDVYVRSDCLFAILHREGGGARQGIRRASFGGKACCSATVAALAMEAWEAYGGRPVFCLFA